MPTDVIMPMLGMNQETGKVLRWLKAEGDAVAKGEAVAEIETDKVTVEVEAPADGVLGVLRAAEGDDVPVGEPFALILAPGEEPPAGASRDEDASVAAAAPPPTSAPAPVTTGNGAAAAPARRPLASPKARRLAAERGVELETLAGSGPHGAVIAADVEAARATVATPAPAAEPLELGAVWARMAERTAASWQSVPHFFLLREVDAGRLRAWREALRRRPGLEDVTVTDLLVKLCAAALAEHPRVNASWRDGRIAAADGVHVGVAVATDDGLVVPVVHDAGGLGLAELAAERTRLVDAARNGRLRPEDVQGGTFTISNLGMYGVDAFLAIVNAPQAAILAVGRIAERVVPVDGVPAVRPVLTLGLSFDHRVVDGARGAEFLDTLAGLVEEPAALVR